MDNLLRQRLDRVMKSRKTFLGHSGLYRLEGNGDVLLLIDTICIPLQFFILRFDIGDVPFFEYRMGTSRRECIAEAAVNESGDTEASEERHLIDVGGSYRN